ncbi:ribonuclease P protein component [Roseisolibacter sp. H3M3-2]|uniref:ribonuclease P protein component n=1 Tax=Roseisolibacter sp. H3M3-2 TaxID=3031323 RepID=UPI0023DCA675|nr:ribonuclease P protein component [Roseisolibacter sp. H3M3-2]MDF1505408.1 ribonuclease P protein component [Roseisolibacter sp. H3M3-2]
MSQRFPRRRRLTRGAELDVVRREGKRVRTEHLEVRVLASLRAFPRLGDAGRVGLVVPKHRHSSVERNRLKRRLRELIRLRLLPLVAELPPVALVVRAHPTAYGATFEALARQVERLRRDVARLAAAPPAPPAAPAPDPARDPAPDVP